MYFYQRIGLCVCSDLRGFMRVFLMGMLLILCVCVWLYWDEVFTNKGCDINDARAATPITILRDYPTAPIRTRNFHPSPTPSFLPPSRIHFLYYQQSNFVQHTCWLNLISMLCLGGQNKANKGGFTLKTNDCFPLLDYDDGKTRQVWLSKS